jgi:hypothetical protein
LFSAVLRSSHRLDREEVRKADDVEGLKLLSLLNAADDEGGVIIDPLEDVLGLKFATTSSGRS